MGSSRVKLGVSAPKKVRKVRNGGSLSRIVNLGAGSPKGYSNTSARGSITFPFDSIRSPYIKASLLREQGLGTGKFTPSVRFGAEYTYDIGKRGKNSKGSRRKNGLKERRLGGVGLTNSDIQKIADRYQLEYLIGKKGK
jgi:hypothetical protein